MGEGGDRDRSERDNLGALVVSEWSANCVPWSGVPSVLVNKVFLAQSTPIA